MAKQLSSGGLLMLFPEGRLNPQPGGSIQPFRFGAFEVARAHDVELWGLCMTGCERVWPADGACGGYAAAVPDGELLQLVRHGAAAGAARRPARRESDAAGEGGAAPVGGGGGAAHRLAGVQLVE